MTQPSHMLPVLVADPSLNLDDDKWRKHVSLGKGDKLRVYPNILMGDFGLSAPLRLAQTTGIGSYGFQAPVSARRLP
jgi:hypothetical protein